MTREECQALVDTLRRQGAETAQIEAKAARGGLPKRLWESLSAFANSPGGGVLVLGLDEAQGFRAVGLTEPAKLQADLASLCDQMDPPLRPLMGLHEVDGAWLLTAEVAELPTQQKPCHYRGAGLQHGAFIRVGDGDRALTPYEVQSLLEGRGQPKHDLEAQSGLTPENLDPARVADFVQSVRRLRPTPFGSWSQEAILQAHAALVPQPGGESLVPSLAGWLCLSAWPQAQHPNLSLVFLRHPQSEAGLLGPNGERHLDEAKLEGPIPDLVSGAMAVLKRNMRQSGVVQGQGRQVRWEYPEVALREVLVNALGHRDLGPTARSAQVQVHMFPDRLEVISPGGLHGPIAPMELGQPGVQSARNPFLMRLMEALPASDGSGVLCEHRGTGLVALKQAMAAEGLPPPEFDVHLTRFRVVLHNRSRLGTKPSATTQPNRHSSGQGPEATYQALKAKGPSSTQALATELGLSASMVRKHLQSLKNQGRVRAQGDSAPTAPNRRYEAL